MVIGLFSTFYPLPQPSIALFFYLKKKKQLIFTVMRICFFFQIGFLHCSCNVLK